MQPTTNSCLYLGKGVFAIGDCQFVELGVFEGRFFPSKVGRHSGELKVFPDFGLLIGCDGPFDSASEVFASLILEDEAVVVFKNRISEAAGVADNGDGSVAHCKHLTEAAGFECTWHEERIATGIDELGEIGVIHFKELHTTRIFSFQSAEFSGRPRVTKTLDNK